MQKTQVGSLDQEDPLGKGTATHGYPLQYCGLPCSSDGKESASSSGDSGLIPGLGKSPGEGNGYPLQYSCLENPMDSGARRVIVHKVAQRQIQLK